ncbi:uncharacterized protein OCT59_023061 [Rhizophagus irregularis]|uniref:Uncharacterized protein n=1 Tax=Rhizophagus irregularis TaxID=588596 RepID=A0A915ZBM4_9GLOM|nr:hypothetical protein OCT59_023061 [Rhizophagus irregularis]CAB5370089.1 unnamed protein product [Rhizophagus irregularis]
MKSPIRVKNAYNIVPNHEKNLFVENGLTLFWEEISNIKQITSSNNYGITNLPTTLNKTNLFHRINSYV